MLRFNTLCLIAVGILVVFPVHGDRDEESTENSKAGADLEAGRLLAEHLVKRVEGTCESGREAYDQAHDGGVDALKKCVHALEDYAKGVRMHEQLAYSTHGRYRRAFVQTYALLSSVLEKDKKNLYKFKETFKADHQKAADYLKGRLDKIKETADEMGGKKPQDATAEPEVSSLLSQSSTAAKRHAVKKSATAVKRKAMKNRHAAVMKTRALKKASTAAKRQTVNMSPTAMHRRGAHIAISLSQTGPAEDIKQVFLTAVRNGIYPSLQVDYLKVLAKHGLVARSSLQVVRKLLDRPGKQSQIELKAPSFDWRVQLLRVLVQLAEKVKGACESSRQKPYSGTHCKDEAETFWSFRRFLDGSPDYSLWELVYVSPHYQGKTMGKRIMSAVTPSSLLLKFREWKQMSNHFINLVKEIQGLVGYKKEKFSLVDQVEHVVFSDFDDTIQTPDNRVAGTDESRPAPHTTYYGLADIHARLIGFQEMKTQGENAKATMTQTRTRIRKVGWPVILTARPALHKREDAEKLASFIGNLAQETKPGVVEKESADLSTFVSVLPGTGSLWGIVNNVQTIIRDKGPASYIDLGKKKVERVEQWLKIFPEFRGSNKLVFIGDVGQGDWYTAYRCLKESEGKEGKFGMNTFQFVALKRNRSPMEEDDTKLVLRKGTDSEFLGQLDSAIKKYEKIPAAVSKFHKHTCKKLLFFNTYLRPPGRDDEGVQATDADDSKEGRETYYKKSKSEYVKSEDPPTLSDQLLDIGKECEGQ